VIAGTGTNASAAVNGSSQTLVGASASLTTLGTGNLTVDAEHFAVRDLESQDAMAESKFQSPGGLVRPHTACERFENCRTSPPRDVKPGNAVAAGCACGGALGPAYRRKPAEPLRTQPLPHLTGGEIHVRLGPLPRPAVVVPIEARCRDPVTHRELVRVANAEPPLFRCIHHEQTTERPERLAAEALLAFLIEEEHAAPGVGGFRGSDEPSETGAGDDDISTVGRSRRRHDEYC